MKKPRELRAVFFGDSEYGWLRVQRRDLAELNIADKISIYSNQNGNWVYLEEYVDAELYTRAVQENDRVLSIRFAPVVDERTAIREMESYRERTS